MIAIIPARVDSQLLPRNNVIDAVRQCDYIDLTMFSTKDEEIEGIFREYGVEIFSMQPEHLAEALSMNAFIRGQGK